MATVGYALGGQDFPQPPMPPKRFPFGHLGAFRANPFRFLLHCRATYGDLVALRFFRLNAYLVCHPDHINNVLQKKQAIYDKDFELVDRLRPILGDGMLTAEGASWKRQRDRAKPAFQGREVQSFGPIITDVIGDVIEDWRGHARDGERLDVHRNMMEVTLRIAGRALFGFDLKAEAEASSALLNETMEAGLKRVNALIAAPMVLPTPNNLVLKRARRSLEQAIDRMIDNRRAAGPATTDLLQRLLDEHDAQEPAKRSAQFYDEAITILLAGHETTANTLAFSLLLLGRHPEIMRKLREETRQVLDKRPAEIGDIPSLVYTRMVLDESMRLYPPAWLIDRHCAEEDEIDGYRIKKDSLILVAPYVTHRHPAFWPDNERFNPTRFSKEQNQLRPRHAFCPFGLGPRVCVGMNFALTEAVMVLASLINFFDVEPTPDHILKLDPNITLRPKNGLPMGVRVAG